MVMMTVPVSFQVFNQSTMILNPLSPNMKPSAGKVIAMKATIGAMLLSGTLCACTSQAGNDAHLYPLGLFGQRVVGNDQYVTVSNVWNEMDALPLAEAHCKQYGKSARFNRMEGPRAIYDCQRG
jgi:hypothetical protein